MSSFEWPPSDGGGGGGGGNIVSINSDTTAAQILNTGSAGTDFAILDNGSGTHTFELPTASAANRGALSPTDWTTFNSKQGALTFGNLTDAGTDGITVTGGTGAVIGSGTSISQHVADATHNGYLSSVDWNTFNSKGVGTVTAVSVASANGLAGTSSGGATPALTLSATVSGIVIGNGTALSAAVAGTDYSAGTSALATGLLKSTTATGALSIATATDITTTLGTLPVNHGGTGVTSVNSHNVILGAGTAAFSAAAPGTAGIALVSLGATSDPQFSTTGINGGGTGQVTKAAAFDALSPLTTKGDMIAYSTTNVRQAVPGDYGQLVADSAQTTGWRSATYTNTDGKPGKNYIQYADAQTGTTTGWTLGTIGALTNGLPSGTPTFGSGAAGTLSFTNISSGQLAGTNSFSLASSAATTAGNMVASSAYSIDIRDQAKMLNFSIAYKVSSGAANVNLSGTSANSIAVAVWDATNSVFLGVTGAFNFVQGTGVGIATGQCQTGASTASLRLILYFPAVTTGAATFLIDDVFFGPQYVNSGPAMQDAQTYTMTITGTTTNPTKATTTLYDLATWRRDGDYMELRYDYGHSNNTGATAGSGTYLFALPSGVTIDSNKIVINTTFAGGTCGAAMFTGSGQEPGTVKVYDSTHVAIFGTDPVNSGLMGSAFVPLSTADVRISFKARVPIVGWSSSSVQSSDANTRVISMAANKANGSVTANTTIPSWTSLKDTAGAFSASTGVYAVPVAGDYWVAAQVAITTAASPNVQVRKNGTVVLYGIGVAASTTETGTISGLVTGCVPGDQITVTLDASLTVGATATQTLWSLYLLSGPAIVQASERVRFKAFNTAGTSIANTGDNNVPFATVAFDTHNAWTGTQYKCPRTDYYSIRGSVNYSSQTYGVNNQLIASVYHNTALDSYGDIAPVMAIVTLPFGSVVDTTVYCQQGDLLEIRAQNTRTAGATTLNTGAGFNHIEISAG